MKYLMSLFFLLSLLSCSSIVGFKELKKFEIDNTIHFLENNKFDTFPNFVVEKTFLENYRILLEMKDTSSFKYLNQPLQVFYFNERDSLISYFVNCNAGGLSKLNWNKDENFSTFPPRSQTFLKAKISSSDIIKFSTPIGKKINTNSHPKYHVFVFYGLMLEKQSRLLIETVRANVINQDAELILFNTDKFYIKE